MAKKRMQMAQKSWEIEEILPISKEKNHRLLDGNKNTILQFPSEQVDGFVHGISLLTTSNQSLISPHHHQGARKEKNGILRRTQKTITNTVTLLTSHSDSITGFRRRTPKTTRTYSYPRMAMEGTPNKYTIGFQWNASLKSPLSVAATVRPEPQPGQYNPVRS